eukprot:gene12444-8533_t
MLLITLCAIQRRLKMFYRCQNFQLLIILLILFHGIPLNKNTNNKIRGQRSFRSSTMPPPGCNLTEDFLFNHTYFPAIGGREGPPFRSPRPQVLFGIKEFFENNYTLIPLLAAERPKTLRPGESVRRGEEARLPKNRGRQYPKFSLTVEPAAKSRAKNAAFFAAMKPQGVRVALVLFAVFG